jgi:predicted nucleic acid-binding protein
MSVLLDTNILSRLVLPVSSQHTTARSAVDSLEKQGDFLCIVPQVLYEFWVIGTRPIGPPSNGLGLTIEQVKTEISRAQTLFDFFPDTPAVYAEWEKLVVQHQVIGRSAHDARLVAAMNVHGIRKILTFNASDFSRYSEIQIIDPSQSIRP